MNVCLILKVIRTQFNRHSNWLQCSAIGVKKCQANVSNKNSKKAAVKQITQEGHSIPDLARRLGITTKSLYNWWARFGDNALAYQATQAQ